MNYAPPDHVKVCVCKQSGNPMGMIMCTFGHLTECHFPLQCHDAACSHLPRYYQEGFDDFPQPGDLEGLEALARKNLADLAAPDCEECQGQGHVETTFEIQASAPPEGVGETFTAQAWYVCPCAALALLKQE